MAAAAARPGGRAAPILRRRHRRRSPPRARRRRVEATMRAHGGVQLTLLRLRRLRWRRGSTPRRPGTRLVEPVDDLRAPGDVAPPREQPHALARQHVAADAQRLVGGRGAAAAVVAPLQQVADAARRVALEQELRRVVDVVVLEHEHRRAVHQRLLRKQRVRLRERTQPRSGTAEVHPPRAVAAGAGRAAAAAARRRRARRVLLRHAVRERRARPVAPVPRRVPHRGAVALLIDGGGALRERARSRGAQSRWSGMCGR